MYREEDKVSRFHSRQTSYMVIVLAILVSLFIFMLAKQYKLAESHEKELLLRHFKERVAHLDNLLARVNEHVDEIRLVAETDLLKSHKDEFLNQPMEFDDLKELPADNRFHLDNLTAPITRNMIGNLTGEGSMKHRNKDYYREIHMALILNPLFRATSEAIKDVAWVYYTSENNFINIYPWVASQDFKFSKELYSHEFYTLGLPENNHYRRRFWTKVYVDEYGKGLMTTCASPVYDQDRFLGTAAIDLTVDFLNTMVKKFNPQQGVMFVVNNSGQLVAHPTLITSTDKTTKTLADAIPEKIRASANIFSVIPDSEIVRIGSYNILRTSLNEVPWHVFYMEDASSWGLSLIKLIGIGPIALMVILLIFSIMVFVFAHQYFILPSIKFLNYIILRSQGIKAQMDPVVPGPWKSWFTAIEGVFSENEKLTEALKEQNENLEQRVKQRTAELEKEIEDRKLVQKTLRKSEMRFRDISYSMADWIWETDRNGRYSFASETIKQILGYEPEEIIGKTPFDMMTANEANRIEEILLKMAHEKRPIVDLESWNISKDGKNVCLVRNALPILDEKGELIGYRGVDKNVTANKIAEEEQKRIESRLKRAEKMESLGTLAGGVAHDLNNILSGIVSYPDLILTQLPEESPLRKPMKTIMETGVKAAAIVQDLLTLARRGVATTKVVNLNTIITEYLSSIEHDKLISFHPKVQVDTNLERNLFNIMGSPVHLSKTVMNLISNAAEAMPMGGKITVSTENRYIDIPAKGYDDVKEGDYIALSISDTGVGISPEDRERIFEPFFTKKVMGRSGTGLGMAVVWGTVKDHQGYIDIESTEGNGTRFTLYFPVTREELIKDRPDLSIEDYMGTGESILVVDDIKEQREIATMILSRLGYNVATSSSGEEAVDYIKRISVDLLILDMIMAPGMDGLETYKQVLEINPEQKAIIASGFSETERVKEAQRLGVGQYIAKPYTLEKIGIAVKGILKK